MAITQLTPYLNFKGTAQEAIAFYERTLGAKVEQVTRYSEVPGMGGDPKHANWVIHCALRVGQSQLMLSDVPPHMPSPDPTPGNIHTAINFDDGKELMSAFEALSAGGKVVIPPHDTFYGGKLGMLVDRFGTSWMLNYSPPPAK